MQEGQHDRLLLLTVLHMAEVRLSSDAALYVCISQMQTYAPTLLGIATCICTAGRPGQMTLLTC